MSRALDMVGQCFTIDSHECLSIECLNIDAMCSACTSCRAQAVESGDTDLVYLVIFHALKHVPLPDVWALLLARPAARSLFVKYCKAHVRCPGMSVARALLAQPR